MEGKMVVYEYIKEDLVAVFLTDPKKKRVGKIQFGLGGWRYYPKGSYKDSGGAFETLEACKKSLEEE